MSYVITAFFGKYLFSDGKMGMMGCPNIYKSSVSLVPKTAYLIDSIGFMFTKCQHRQSFIYNELRDFRESLSPLRLWHHEACLCLYRPSRHAVWLGAPLCALCYHLPQCLG